MWSKKEKDIARGAFGIALEREGLDLLSRLKEMMNTARNHEDVWKIHDFLTKSRKDIDQKYDYRYSVLIPVFGRLFREGWISSLRSSGSIRNPNFGPSMPRIETPDGSDTGILIPATISRICSPKSRPTLRGYSGDNKVFFLRD